MFTFFLSWFEKFSHCLSKTFYIKCRGDQTFLISHASGVKIFSVALRGGSKFVSCYSIFDHPLLLSYK